MIKIFKVVFFLSIASFFLNCTENKENNILNPEQLQLDSISNVKEYNINDYNQIGLHNIVLKTKFESKKILFIFSADLVDENGVKFKAITPYPLSPSIYDHITFKFYDKDGFAIAKDTIKLREITKIVDQKGNAIKLQCDGEFKSLNKELYLKIKNIDFEWNF